MTSTLCRHTCGDTPENTFSTLHGNAPRQNLITKKISPSGVIGEFHIPCVFAGGDIVTGAATLINRFLKRDSESAL